MTTTPNSITIPSLPPTTQRGNPTHLREETKINSYYAYTQTGAFHKQSLSENQDTFLHGENDRIEAVVLADGVSSVRCGKKGAELACETVMNILLSDGVRLFDMNSERVAQLILDRIMDKIEENALSAIPSDYASTLAFACRDKWKNRVLTFSLGDTLLYTVSEDGCSLISQPDIDSDGRCCVTTTRGAEKRVNIELYDASEINAFMLCTDGAWQCLYNNTQFKEELHGNIVAGNFDALKKHLQKEEPGDDCSFIVMSIPPTQQE